MRQRYRLRNRQRGRIASRGQQADSDSRLRFHNGTNVVPFPEIVFRIITYSQAPAFLDKFVRSELLHFFWNHIWQLSCPSTNCPRFFLAGFVPRLVSEMEIYSLLSRRQERSRSSSLLPRKGIASMRKLLRILPLLALLLLPLGQAVAASITVTASTDAMAMANALASTGITVNSATLVQGASTQQGFFTGGTGNLPFDSGILLTTGSIQNAVGPNNLVNTTTDIGSAGDVQLSSLAGYATHDANILHIVFTPTSNVISFQFAFGSEEYNYFVNSQFNDVFAFYLNGANIALVPGTTDPISVNSIDCLHNAAYYVNNDPFNTTLGGCAAGSNAGLDMEYNGFAGGLGALPLYATGAVNPNVQNTIDLKIADGSDDLLDSGIFLAADSFKPEPPPTVPEPASLLLLASGLGSLGLLRKKLRK